jgi:hypothetical protein
MNQSLGIRNSAVAIALLALICGCGGKGAVAEKEQKETILAGTVITAALQSTVSTESGKAGDRIELRTLLPVRVNEKDIVPVGSVIRGEVTHSEGGGRLGGAPELTLRFTELAMTDGSSYPIACEPFRVKGKSDTKETVGEIGGGAVAGGIVGGVLGGSKGDIAKGAAVGAILGTGVAVATKGNQIVLPAGQKLRVTLTTPVAVTLKASTPS